MVASAAEETIVHWLYLALGIAFVFNLFGKISHCSRDTDHCNVHDYHYHHSHDNDHAITTTGMMTTIMKVG